MIKHISKLNFGDMYLNRFVKWTFGLLVLMISFGSFANTFADEVDVYKDLENQKVWLVLAEEENRKIVGLSIVESSVFVGEDPVRSSLYNVKLSYAHEKDEFSFDREDIAYLKFYNNRLLSLSGPPLKFTYQPVTVLKSGDLIEQAPSSVWPTNALKDKSFKTMNARDVQFYGKQKTKYEIKKFEHRVIALAWSKEDVQKALKDILEEFANKEYRRELIKFNEPKSIMTSYGVYEVNSTAKWEVKYRGPYRSTQEKTQGEVILSVNGTEYGYTFTDTCLNTLRYETSNCRAQPRVNSWRDGPNDFFRQVHINSSGVTLFFPSEKSRRPVALADLMDMNIGISD